MDKYLIIFRGGYYPDELRDDADFRKKEMSRWIAWIEKLTKAGKFIGGQPLEVGGKVVRDRGRSVMDGPYPEGKEIVGGYFLVTADSMDQAVGYCKHSPDWDYGGVIEVRKVAQLPGHP